MQRVMEFTYKGRSTTYLYLANIGEVCSRSRDSEGVVWWWGGGGKGLFWGSYRGLFWRKCLAKMAFCLKEASKGLGPPDTCHRGR